MKTSRNVLVDIEKAVGIFFVVGSHLIYPYNRGIHLLLSMCNMSVFFFVSGFFFYKENRKYPFFEFLKVKSFRLIIPYLAWSSVSLATSIALSGDCSLKTIGTEFFNIFCLARSVWFFIALYILLVVMRIAYESCQKIDFPYPLAMIIVWILFFLIKKDDLLAVRKLKEFSAFFIAGYSINYLKIKERSFDCRLLSLSAPLVILIGWKAFDFSLPEGRFPYDSFSTNIFWLSGSFLGLLTVIGLADILNHTAFLRHKASLLGRYSMDIYVQHMFLIKFIQFFYKKGREPQDSLTLFLFAACICFFILIISKYLMRKNKLYRFCIGEKGVEI